MTDASPSESMVIPTRAEAGKPRLGFIGVGWIGRSRLEAIARDGAAEIAAVCDPSPEALDKAREFAPEAARCTSYAELLAADLDGIVIATPSALHAEQAISALQSGKAVFCQKPLARTARETQAVLDTARAVDRLLGVDLSYRHTAALRRVRELVRGGGLGRIYAAEAVFHNAYGPDKPWFYDAQLAGGGCLLDLGIHLVDAVLWCLDFPDVSSTAAVLTRGGEPWTLFRPGVEDYAAGLLQLSTGAAVQLACSWKLPAGCDARIDISFYGTQGGVSFHNLNGSFYEFAAERFRPDRSREPLVMPPDDWSGRAAVEWARRLATSRRFDPAIEHLSSVALTLDQLYAREGTVIDPTQSARRAVN